MFVASDDSESVCVCTFLIKTKSASLVDLVGSDFFLRAQISVSTQFFATFIVLDDLTFHGYVTDSVELALCP